MEYGLKEEKDGKWNDPEWEDVGEGERRSRDSGRTGGRLWCRA